MNHPNQYPNQNRNRRMPQGKDSDLLSRLQAVDFAIQETVLFLDAYPKHKQALDYYHKLQAQRRQLMEAHEKDHAPITIHGNNSRTSWDWVNSPWPWEIDAN